MKQPWYISHAETLAQNIVGLACGFIILRVYGIPATHSFGLQAVFFVVAYIRSYTIRRFFANRPHLGARCD